MFAWSTDRQRGPGANPGYPGARDVTTSANVTAIHGSLRPPPPPSTSTSSGAGAGALSMSMPATTSNNNTRTYTRAQHLESFLSDESLRRSTRKIGRFSIFNQNATRSGDFFFIFFFSSLFPVNLLSLPSLNYFCCYFCFYFCETQMKRPMILCSKRCSP
jgi:hypothetical protein